MKVSLVIHDRRNTYAMEELTNREIAMSSRVTSHAEFYAAMIDHYLFIFNSVCSTGK